MIFLIPVLVIGLAIFEPKPSCKGSKEVCIDVKEEEKKMLKVEADWDMDASQEICKGCMIIAGDKYVTYKKPVGKKKKSYSKNGLRRPAGHNNSKGGVSGRRIKSERKIN